VIVEEIQLPSNFDWRYWVKRFEKMQKRYLVRWEDRFEIIVRLLEAKEDDVNLVVDLGCGAGSLAERILKAFGECKITAIDFDPTLLMLAKARLGKFGKRARIVLQDLREKSWTNCVKGKVDAVVSATALHWFSADQLTDLYQQLAGVLKPSGIFLNADHVASDSAAIQKAWEQHREIMRNDEGYGNGDAWDGFFEACAEALNMDVHRIRQKAIGQWVGVEEGLPLAWHFDRLQECGFASVDCFWRCDCDAVYGAIRG